jgi:hypothetical protein
MDDGSRTSNEEVTAARRGREPAVRNDQLLIASKNSVEIREHERDGEGGGSILPTLIIFYHCSVLM